MLGLAAFARLSTINKLAALEALITLAAASAAIRTTSFKRVAAWASHHVPDNALAAQDRFAAVNRCRWAVRRSARAAPWKSVCFQQGLALHLMLRRRGIASRLHYGVAQEAERGLTAHVWVSVEGKIVLGGEEAGKYACLATFPS